MTLPDPFHPGQLFEHAPDGALFSPPPADTRYRDALAADRLALEQPAPCRVCARPLPRCTCPTMETR